MKVNVIYWTGTGNTEIMAKHIVEGAEAGGADVKLIFVSDATVEDFKDADAVALGCPAMGAEELEEYEFAPYMDSVKEFCNGKKILLFGSYNWADGEWMRTWTAEMNDLGADLVEADGLICLDDPDADFQAVLQAAGKKLAGA